jgi:hypothetical protein
MNKKNSWILFLILGSGAIAWWINSQLKIDGCLDSGGKWNYESKVCKK